MIKFRILIVTMLFINVSLLSAEEGESGIPINPPSEIDGKIILGEKETVYFEQVGIFLNGRIDTGAGLSSIHGRDIDFFEREGRSWVRFNLNHDGLDRILERPVQRVIRVRQAGSSRILERPVIILPVRIGRLEIDADFSVTDRSHMSYPVLIGRNVLKGRALVDVSYQYLHRE